MSLFKKLAALLEISLVDLNPEMPTIGKLDSFPPKWKKDYERNKKSLRTKASSSKTK